MKIYLKCSCGAEMSVSDVDHYVAKEFAKEWFSKHEKLCLKVDKREETNE